MASSELADAVSDQQQQRTGKSKQHRLLGASAEQVQHIYEQTILSTLHPKVVLGIVCAKEKTIILLADGNVYDFPRNGLPRLVQFPERARSRIIQIAAGDSHFVALTDHLVWNIYTWSASGSSITEGVLGRRCKTDELARTPDVVKDMPGRVIRISCGVNFTLCGTATGELWGIGPANCYFGQEKSASTSNPFVVKLYWGSNGDQKQHLGATQFAAAGRFGLAYRLIDRANDKPPHQHFSTSQKDLADSTSTLKQVPTASVTSQQSVLQQNGRASLTATIADKDVPSVQEWFIPETKEEELILKHAVAARDKSLRASLEHDLRREEESQMRLMVSILQGRVARQEARTEEYARTMVPYSQSGEFSIPPKFDWENERQSHRRRQQPLEEDEEEAHQQRVSGSSNYNIDGVKISRMVVDPLEVRMRKLHIARIRDKLDEEREMDQQLRARDANICAKRLAEAVSLLSILRKDQAEAEKQLARVTRMARESEIAADDWRTRALLLERALLRLKRERRMRSDFVERTGECRVFPSIGWKSSPASSSSDGNESIFIASASTPEKGDLYHQSSAAGKSRPVVWIRARTDPDWGLRLNMIQLRIKSNKSGTPSSSSCAVMERIFVSNSLPLSSTSNQRTDNQGLLTPAKQQFVTRFNGKASKEGGDAQVQEESVIDLQRHTSVVVSHVGEDCYFYLGFRFSNISEEQIRQWALNVREIIVRFEDDVQVSERIQQEVDQVGHSDPQTKRDWEKLSLEVLG